MLSCFHRPSVAQPRASPSINAKGGGGSGGSGGIGRARRRFLPPRLWWFHRQK